MPPEFFGKTVECPQCNTRFAAPIPAIVKPVTDRAAGEAGPSDAEVEFVRRALAANALRPPALMLLVVTALNLFCCGWGVLSARVIVADPNAFEVQMHQRIDEEDDLPPAQRDRLKEIFSAQAVRRHERWILTCPGLLTASSFLVLLGCIQMFRLRAYPVCVLGAVLALNPLNIPCCLLQFPFGLWALIVLLNPDVRQSFS